VEGIASGSETEEMPRGRDVFWPIEAIKKVAPKALQLNGHYHTRQVFKGIHHCGSLARLTHAEEGNTPAFSVYDL
jgi:hypothetical protein